MVAAEPVPQDMLNCLRRLRLATIREQAASDALDIQVFAILQDGCVHHRHALSTEVGANVRQVRASVSRPRSLGWPIGFGATGGYRLAWERPALEALMRKYRSQAVAFAPTSW